MLTNGWILALFAVSLTLVAGTTGILSLGHAGLMALGAYTSGLLTLKLGWPFETSFVAAGLVAAGLGTLLASPALRLKGHYLSIATLALGEIVNQTILNAEPLTNGALGLAGIPVPSIFGHSFNTTADFYYLSLAVLVVGVAVVVFGCAVAAGQDPAGAARGRSGRHSLGSTARTLQSRGLRYCRVLGGLGGRLVGSSLFVHQPRNLQHDVVDPWSDDGHCRRIGQRRRGRLGGSLLVVASGTAPSRGTVPTVALRPFAPFCFAVEAPRGPGVGMTLLETRNLSRSFGGVQAVVDLALTVGRGRSPRTHRTQRCRENDTVQPSCRR